ncbi:SCO family protein [Psychromonas algicola]|uniref:SCO family protein n=1 Tax=Psychromonas algicola TaxID=2555642 RepID=UPI0010686501|nr:SCO family protein [Psychromonas sp. RZ5]TEW52705.1 SCO family protein [Psychromonas sp. RZ5]
MKRWIILISAVVMIAVVGLGVSQFSQSKNDALVLTEPPTPLPEFSFHKAGKVAFSNESLKGKWSLLFIGYTYCPDVCPTTLADLNYVYPSLTNDQDTTTQVVFISVDPNRDKAEQLADYVNYFNENFIGVTSTHEQLWPFVTELGLIYSVVEEGETNEYYLIDHSASIVLINPEGQFHATFKSVVNEQGINHVDMELMVEDIKRIQSEYL